jgi:hypothetical protein
VDGRTAFSPKVGVGIGSDALFDHILEQRLCFCGISMLGILLGSDDTGARNAIGTLNNKVLSSLCKGFNSKQACILTNPNPAASVTRT